MARRDIPQTNPPTIGDCRRQKQDAFFVTCARGGCFHRKRFTFDELNLPDTMIFVNIPFYFRFRCVRCGERRITLTPDWSNHAVPGHPGFVATNSGWKT